MVPSENTVWNDRCLLILILQDDVMFESMVSHHRDVYDSLSRRIWVSHLNAVSKGEKSDFPFIYNSFLVLKFILICLLTESRTISFTHSADQKLLIALWFGFPALSLSCMPRGFPYLTFCLSVIGYSLIILHFTKKKNHCHVFFIRFVTLCTSPPINLFLDIFFYP